VWAMDSTASWAVIPVSDLDELERLAGRLRDRGFPKLAPIVRSDLVLRSADAIDALVARVRQAEAEVVKITANRDDWASRMMELVSVTQRAERAEAVIAKVEKYAREREVNGHRNRTVGSVRIASDLLNILSTYEKGVTQ
ncbi:MAG TPA: hypothetical protein PK890_11725, partial [Terrimesophilobacter sp.]|nr:hypothetical protein [Terrimesophilobacter sp.]